MTVTSISQRTEHVFEPITPEASEPKQHYPVEALGALAPHCHALAKHAAEYPTLPAQCLLAALSLATQALYDVKYLPGVRSAPTALYLLSIGVSGQRKTTCFAPAIKAISDCEQARAAIYTKAMQDYQTTKEEATPAPSMAWLMMRDPTISGIMQTFGQGSHSLGLFNDDAGNFIEGAAMGRDEQVSTMAALNNAWGSGTWETTRAKHGGTWKLFHRWLSIHLMAQPEMVATALSNPKAKGSGYLARFLIAHPDTTMGTQAAITPFDIAMAPEQQGAFTLMAFNNVITRLLSFTHPRKKYLVNSDMAALMAFHDFNTSIELQLGEQGQYHTIADFGRKACEHAARLAANLCIYEHFEHQPTASPNHLTMTEHQAQRGITLINDYYLPEYKRLTSPEHSKDIHVEALQLFKRMINQPKQWQTVDEGFVSQSAITRYISANNHVLQLAFKRLLEHGYLIEEHYRDSRNREKTRYQINPACQASHNY